MRLHVSWRRFVRLQDGKAAAQLNSISAPRNFRGTGKCAGEGGKCPVRRGVACAEYMVEQTRTAPADNKR